MQDTDCKLDSSATPQNKPSRNEPDENLLFIHQFSIDALRTCHGPDRRIKGSYVQRNIHRAKRMRASSRLMNMNGPATLNSLVSVAHLPRFQPRAFQNQRNLLVSEETRLSNKPVEKVAVDCWLAPRNSCADAFNSPVVDNGTTKMLETTLSERGQLSRLSHVELFIILLPSSTKECFRYYLNAFVLKVFPVFPIAREHCHWVFQAATSSQELLFAISALGSAMSLAAQKRKNEKLHPSQRHQDLNYMISVLNELWFKAKAMALVSVGISSSDLMISETVLYTVMCLLLAAIISGNRHEMNTHALGLRKLIELRGNYDRLPVHAVAAILSIFYISCTIAQTPPIPIPLVAIELNHIRTTFFAAFESYPSLRNIGCGFADHNFTMSLSQSLGRACEEMRAYVTLIEYLRRSQRTPTATEMAYYHSKNLNFHFLATRIPFEDNTSDKQESFRLALLIFWNANTQLNGPDSMLYQTLTTRLKTSLEKQDLEIFWRNHCSILLWIMLLGAFASRGQVEHSWFVAQMAKGLMLKKTEDWHSTETALQRLFYIEPIFQQSFKQSWEDVGELRLLPNTE